MEDRELNGVERELRGYLSSQLDRLPVRSSPTFSRPARRWVRWVASVPATMLIVLVAVGAGLALADWRAHRVTPDESQATSGGVPGPLALAGGAPSLGFGLISTSANTLLVRNEITEAASLTISPALPQVAVSPNGHEIAYWRVLPDRQTGQAVYELLRSDLIDPAARDRLVMRAPSGEVPGPTIWSSDGAGLVANTRTAPTRGSDAGSPTTTTHASWFKIDIASGKIDQMPQMFADRFSLVYAWDRSRDLVTGSTISFGSPSTAGGPTFLTFKAGIVESHVVPSGGVIAAADLYAKSVVIAYAGGCKGPPQDSTLRCPVLEVRDQATFSIVTGSGSYQQGQPQGTEATSDFPDVVFRPRSQDLIVQLPLKSGDARVELWSDLGRGPHVVLATYTQLVRGTIRFASRRELILPRVDGSAVFLLKFDSSSGGRWFGEIVSLGPTSTTRSGLGPERTPFEILTGGNPLASVVLDPAFARAMDSRLGPSPKPSPSSSAARDAILQRFSRTTAEIRRVDRIDAKLMTRAEFDRSANTGSSSPNVDPNQLIWVVAISGEVVPQFSRGQAFTWGIYLVSADSGDILGMLAGAGPWPPYFDSLPNRESTASSARPTPTLTVTARPGCGRVETGDIQVCPGAGPIGSSITVTGRSWSCTVPGERVDLVFVGNEGESVATGAEGGFSFPGIQPDTNGDWSITVRIPAVLDTDHGRGGGPTTPGIYRIISKPAYCTADFSVTP